MKNSKTSNNIFLLIMVFSIGSFINNDVYAQSKLHSAIVNFFKHKKHLDRVNDKKEVSRDMDEDGFELSIMQDFEKTKDPALGYPPTERLQIVRDLIDNSPSSRAIQGLNWIERGPINVGGRTRAILFDPNFNSNKAVYAGAADGGLWHTDDISQTHPTWTHLSEFWDNLAISCIAADPNTNSNSFHEIFVGTGESWTNPDAVIGNGIYFNDGVNGWAPLSITLPATPSDFKYVNKIVVNPISGPNSSVRIYVGTNTGLWQLTRGGAWSHVPGITVHSDLRDKVCDIKIAGSGLTVDFYASLGWDGYSNGIYKLSSGSSLWVPVNLPHVNNSTAPITNFDRIELATSPTSISTVYALVNFQYSYGPTTIYKSTDGGNSWPSLIEPPDINIPVGGSFTRGQGYYDLAAAVDPSDANILYVGGINLHKWDGTQWAQLSSWDPGSTGLPYVHADQHAIVFSPDYSSSNNILFSNDGGVYINNSTLFIDKNYSYNTAQLYSCAAFPKHLPNNDIFLAGTQDNETQHFFGNAIPSSPIPVLGGDGGYCFIDEYSTSSNTAPSIASIYFDNFFQSFNAGSAYVSTGFPPKPIPLGHPTDLNNIPGAPCKVHYFIDPADYDSRFKILYYSDEYSMELNSFANPCDVPHLSKVTGIDATPSQSIIQIPFPPSTVNQGDIR